MAKEKRKDPAFLFYDGDAARDVSHMSRLERGCYFDLIQAQRKFHGITAELARKILGKDFDECWPALEIVLSQDEKGYYIEWLREAIKERAEHAEIQRKRIQDYWDKVKAEKEGKNNTAEIPRNNQGITAVIPLEDEDEDEDEDEEVKEIKIGVQGKDEKLKQQFEIFRQLYPGTKRGLDQEWDNFRKKHKTWRKIVPELSDKLTYQISARIEAENNGVFVPAWKNLPTYLNNDCWTEEINTVNTGATNNGRDRKISKASDGSTAEDVARHFATKLGLVTTDQDR